MRDDLMRDRTSVFRGFRPSFLLSSNIHMAKNT